MLRLTSERHHHLLGGVTTFPCSNFVIDNLAYANRCILDLAHYMR